MSSKLSGRISKQFTVGGGFHAPFTSRSSRGISPSFADALQPLTISGFENVTLTIATPSIASGASAVVSGTQGLRVISGLTVTSSDLGQFHIGNVSTVGPANAIIGHPQIQVVTTQGTPGLGALTTGQTYNGVTLSASATLYAAGAVSAGSLVITATILLLGTVLGN